jgi:GTP cyclohydrolase II
MRREVSDQLLCLARSGIHVMDRKMDLFVFGRRNDQPDAVALVNGYRRHPDDAALVRIHSACFTGDILGSDHCDCGRQLHSSLDLIGRSPWGILIYLVRDEGRGMGLVRKIDAYALQEEGYDTVSANAELHAPIDSRDYAAATMALDYLGVNRVWLLTNSPDKLAVVKAAGIHVEGIQRLAATATTFNRTYIQTKEAVFGHRITDDDLSDHDDT